MGFFKWVSNIFGRGRDEDHSLPPRSGAHHEGEGGSTNEQETTPIQDYHYHKGRGRGRGREIGRGGDFDEEDEDDHVGAVRDDELHNTGGLGWRNGGARGHRRGFSMPVYMAVEKSQLGPLLVECPFRNGGVQGLDWCGQLLLMDEDGDVAHEFYEEKLMPLPTCIQWKEEHGSMTLGNHIAVEKQWQQQSCQGGRDFVRVNRSVRPANVRRVDLRDGQVRYLIEDSDCKCHWA